VEAHYLDLAILRSHAGFDRDAPYDINIFQLLAHAVKNLTPFEHLLSFDDAFEQRAITRLQPVNAATSSSTI